VCCLGLGIAQWKTPSGGNGASETSRTTHGTKEDVQLKWQVLKLKLANEELENVTLKTEAQVQNILDEKCQLESQVLVLEQTKQACESQIYSAQKQAQDLHDINVQLQQGIEALRESNHELQKSQIAMKAEVQNHQSTGQPQELEEYDVAGADRLLDGAKGTNVAGGPQPRHNDNGIIIGAVAADEMLCVAETKHNETEYNATAQGEPDLAYNITEDEEEQTKAEDSWTSDASRAPDGSHWIAEKGFSMLGKLWTLSLIFISAFALVLSLNVVWSRQKQILAMLRTVFFSVIIPPEASSKLPSVIVWFSWSVSVYLHPKENTPELSHMIPFVCFGLCVTDLMLGWWLLNALCNFLTFTFNAVLLVSCIVPDLSQLSK